MPASVLEAKSESGRKRGFLPERTAKGRIGMADSKRAGKRSPLKRKPLRNPGESLQDEIHTILTEQMIPPMVVAFLSILIAAMEWWRYFRAAPPQPVILSALAFLAVIYGSYKVVAIKKRIRALRLGMDGEKAVGQFLEALRKQGCRIFHDIVGNGFNIDHVVIGPRGLFTVETKTYSKPARGRATAACDGERILFNGLEPDRNPITQARAARDWLRELLLENTARKFPVKGVVVLPGWYVESTKGSRPDIWVLNPKAFPSFIEHEPVVLKDEDIALASSRLINYVTR